MKQAGQVAALLSTKKVKLKGPDPITTNGKSKKVKPASSNLYRGNGGDPMVKGVKPVSNGQKTIAYPSKNVKLGGMRSKSLVHD